MHCSLCGLCSTTAGTLNEVLGHWMRMWCSKREVGGRQPWECGQSLSNHVQMLLTQQHLHSCVSVNSRLFALWLLRSASNLRCLLGGLNMQL